MPPLTDAEKLAHFKNCLSQWSNPDEIQWADDALRSRERECECSVREINEEMWLHVQAGGAINEVVEKREPYCREWSHHYDFSIEVAGKKIYVETRLDDSSGVHDPYIWVVNVHDKGPVMRVHP